MKGAHVRDYSRLRESREVVLRIAAAHQDKRALDILGMELAYVPIPKAQLNSSPQRQQRLESHL